MKKKVVSVFFLSLFLCASAHADNDTVLAKIGDRKLTTADFDRMTSIYAPDKQKLLEQNPQYKAILLRRFVQGMVIAKIARAKGFDKRSDVQEQLELVSNDLLAAEYLEKEIVDKVNVTEDDMKIYYKAHQEEFKTPEMVKARHVLIKVMGPVSDETKGKAKQRAEELLTRIKAGEDFGKLASEFSDDPASKTKGGDLGFFPKGKMVPEFEKVAFSLKPGEVSIVETVHGYHIIEVEEKKEAVVEPYDKAKDKVKEKVFNDLKKARVDEFVEQAMKDAGAELNLEPFLPKK